MKRKTLQKIILEKQICTFKTFFTAEDLLNKAKSQDNRIGIATIYRFLNDNSNKHKVHYYYCNRKKIYSTVENNHCHFICEKCGNVSHFNISEIDFIKKKY